MSYFTDYKRQMMGHSRYFEPPPPHDYLVDFRRNNFEGAFHHQQHQPAAYTDLPSRFSNNYGHGPAIGTHMHGSYDNLMFHHHQQHQQQQQHMRRSRESYQHETTASPAASPYYYHNNNANTTAAAAAASPMMNQYYPTNEPSYRKDSSPYHHHWMGANAAAAAGASTGYVNNSQYYPPTVNYGNSSSYYPTPPPSASPAGNFYPSSKSDHRLPNYDYDYYSKKKNADAAQSTEHNQGYYNGDSNPATRPGMYSPKLDYHVGHPTPPDVESQQTATEQRNSPASSESSSYQKSRESSDGRDETEKTTTANDSGAEKKEQEFYSKRSESTDADEKAPRNEPKTKSKEIESQTGPEHEYKTHPSPYANTLPEHSRDEFYENSQRYQQQMAPDFHAHMMSSSREMLNRKRHKSWLESNKKSNRRYSLLESKSSSLENHSQRSQKMMYNNFSPTISRKRKFNSESRNDLRNNDAKDTIPLPGFLQTFGQTEIGKFSEAFCSSSDSPFYNSIESDLDSPHMWEHDSLEGPVQMTTSFQICAADVNYDSSPLNNFGELICNEC